MYFFPYLVLANYLLRVCEKNVLVTGINSPQFLNLLRSLRNLQVLVLLREKNEFLGFERANESANLNYSRNLRNTLVQNLLVRVLVVRVLF